MSALDNAISAVGNWATVVGVSVTPQPFFIYDAEIDSATTYMTSAGTVPGTTVPIWETSATAPYQSGSLLMAAVIGQDDGDFVQNPAGNGDSVTSLAGSTAAAPFATQDIHIQLSGLKNQHIKAVSVKPNGHGDYEFPSAGGSQPVAFVRPTDPDDSVVNGMTIPTYSAVGDLYLAPYTSPPIAFFENGFNFYNIHIIYDDNTYNDVSAYGVIGNPLDRVIERPVAVVGITATFGAQTYTVTQNQQFSTSPSQVVVQYSQPLAWLVPDDPNGGGVAGDQGDPLYGAASTFYYAVQLTPSGPDGYTTWVGTSHATYFSGPTALNVGDLPLPAKLVYHVNVDGTSTITLIPEEQQLSSDIYLISAAGDMLSAGGYGLASSNDVYGARYATFETRVPTNGDAPTVVSVTTLNGAYTITSGGQVPLPDTLAVNFSKPMASWSVNSTSIKLWYYPNSSPGTQPVPVPAAVTYSPATNTAYVTPTATLTAWNALSGNYYLVAVYAQAAGGGLFQAVSDDQSLPNVGATLAQDYYASFAISPSQANPYVPQQPSGVGMQVAYTGPTGGAYLTSPAVGTAVPGPLGYATMVFTQPVNMDSNHAGPYTFMIKEQYGGLIPGQFDVADVAENSRAAYNPNLQEIVLIMTSNTPSDNYLYQLGTVTSATTGQTTSGFNQAFRVSGGAGAPAVMRRRSSTVANGAASGSGVSSGGGSVESPAAETPPNEATVPAAWTTPIVGSPSRLERAVGTTTAEVVFRPRRTLVADVRPARRRRTVSRIVDRWCGG